VGILCSRVVGFLVLAGGQALAQVGGAGAGAVASAAASPPRPWWLTALSLLANAAIVIGAVAIIGTFRGGRAGRAGKMGGRNPNRIVAAAGVILGVGALTHALLPKWPPPAHDTITDQVFSSARMPAIDLQLPAGWRLTYGEAEGFADVVTATSAADAGPRHTLVVQSSLLEEPVDRARLASDWSAGMAKSAATLTPRSETEVDGRKATVLAATRPDGTRVTVWIVQRATHLVSYLYCFAPAPSEAPCAPAIAQLRWHAVAGAR
jgi:hypothetical protein